MSTPLNVNPASVKPLRAVVGRKYTYSRPMLSTFALDGVVSGTTVVASKGCCVGRAPHPWVYVDDEQGNFLGMTTVYCLQPLPKVAR